MDESSAARRENTETSPRPDSSGFQVEGTQMNRRLWIGSNSLTNPNHTLSVKTRLVQAIEYLKNSTRDKDVTHSDMGACQKRRQTCTFYDLMLIP
ncbi:hypothetical protein FXO37_36675 [Capsicum annuum]|nr:hypothetical protein FXO37_36675 [Capsicum annuum]